MEAKVFRTNQSRVSDVHKLLNGSISTATSKSTVAIPVSIKLVVRNHAACVEDVSAVVTVEQASTNARKISARPKILDQCDQSVAKNYQQIVHCEQQEFLGANQELLTPPKDCSAEFHIGDNDDSISEEAPKELPRPNGGDVLTVLDISSTSKTAALNSCDLRTKVVLGADVPQDAPATCEKMSMLDLLNDHPRRLPDIPVCKPLISEDDQNVRALPWNFLPRSVLSKSQALPIQCSHRTADTIKDPRSIPAFPKKNVHILFKSDPVVAVRKKLPPLIKIAQQTTYDGDLLEKAGSGEFLTLRVLAVEADMPVIQTWVSQDPFSGLPAPIAQIDKDVARFVMEFSSIPVYRPRLGQAVAVLTGERGSERTWARGQVRHSSVTNVTVYLVDHGGFVTVTVPCREIVPLSKDLASRPVWVWRARVAGIRPSRYQSDVAAEFAELLVDQSISASLIQLYPEPWVRLFCSVQQHIHRPVEILTVLTYRRLKKNGMAPHYGVVLYVSKDPSAHYCLLLDTRDIRHLEVLQAKVWEDAHKEQPATDRCQVAAIKLNGQFFRVVLSSDPQPDGSIHVELVEFGYQLIVAKSELCALSSPVELVQSRCVMSTLFSQSGSNVDLDDWMITAERLRQIQGKVAVFRIVSRKDKDSQVVQIWDEHGEEISRNTSRPRAAEFIRAKHVPYVTPVFPGDIISVKPVSIDWKRRALTVIRDPELKDRPVMSDAAMALEESKHGAKVNKDAFQADSLEVLMDCLQLDGNVAVHLSSMPDEGVVVSVLAAPVEKLVWCRAVVVQRNLDDSTVLVFLLDFGTYDIVPLWKLAEVSYPLAVHSRSGLALILDGIENSNGIVDPEVVGRDVALSRLINQPCQFEVTKVEDWFIRVILLKSDRQVPG